MKFSMMQITLALIFSGMALAHTNHAQEVLTREVSLHFDGVTLGHALTELEVATKVKFVYSRSHLKLDELISLDVEGKTLMQVLDELLIPRGIQYNVQDNNDYIVLTPIKEKNGRFEKIGSTAEEQSNVRVAITGTVTSTDKAPIAGVNVIVKGTTVGTSTDANGVYTIDAKDADVLVFSFIGFKSYETQVSGRAVIDVVLEEDIASLSEVTINAGYWQVKDREKTGNIARVKADDIAKNPVSNPLAAMQGRMAGVQVTQGTGVPGGNFTVQIRGRNSLTSGNDPLYIVDGVPFPAAPMGSSSLGKFITGGGNSVVGSPLSGINPADIESIEVLKDADATAIYGSRGANGVVLITTKKGTIGKTKVDVNVYTGGGQVSRMMDMLNTQQYLQMRHEAFRNDGTTPQDYDYDLTMWDTTRYTNWQKKLIGGTARTTNAQVSLSGGNANTQFLVGGTYHKETTVFPGDFGYQKLAGHFTLNHTSDDQKFKAVISMNYINVNNRLPNADMTGDAVLTAPDAPDPYDANGRLNFADGTFSNNPFAKTITKFETTSNNMISNLTLSYQLLPQLQLKANLGYTRLQLNEKRTDPKAAYDPSWGVTSGTAQFNQNVINTWIVEPQAVYNTSLGGGKLTTLIGTTFQQNVGEQVQLSASGFSSDALLESVRAASTVTVAAENYSQYRYEGVFGRINYDWQGKYIMNLTARRDGSSRFGPGKRFGNFGAVGAAWVFSEENLIKSGLPFLSFGKLRSSYGTVGNDQILNYGHFQAWSSTTNPYQGVQGLSPSGLYNPNTSWETTKKLEVGLDLAFLNDRLQLSSSYYRNRSSNQLISYSLPGSTGNLSVQQNFPATVENKGWEFVLTTTNVKTTDFTWETSFNLTVSRNKLLKFPGLASSSYASTFELGQPLRINKVFRSTGVDPATGIYTFADQDGDGAASYPNDVVATAIIQNYFGGLSNTFTFRDFKLDLLFQYVKQNGQNYLNYFDAPGIAINQPTVVMGRWQKPGDVTKIQQFTQDYGSAAYDAFSSAAFLSDQYLTDASFIRLKNVSLSYQLPAAWMKKAHAQQGRVYLQGQNLLTFTNYIGMDPENQSVIALPALKMLTAGFQFTF